MVTKEEARLAKLTTVQRKRVKKDEGRREQASEHRGRCSKGLEEGMEAGSKGLEGCRQVARALRDRCS